jgi:pimeloyl-ACP methyl ester carboxylesterase
MMSLLPLLAGCGGARHAVRSDDVPAPLDPEMVRLSNVHVDVRGHWIPDDVFGGSLYVITAAPTRAAASAKAPPLFLVHGLGEAGVRDFYPIIGALAQRRPVVAFDLPGFGRSGRANARYTPDRYAAVLSRVIDRYAPDGPVDVVGHSMGGAIALLHAAVYPRQVRRLVLVDAAGILQREALVGHHVRRATDPTGLFMPGLAAWALGVAAAAIDETRKLDPAPALIMEIGLLRQQVLRGDPGAIAALGLILHNFGPEIAQVQAPTAIIWGADDVVAPLRTAQLLVDRLAQAHLTVLDGVGHNPMTDAPGRLLVPLERHLSGPDDPSAAVLAAPLTPRAEGTCHGKADVVFAEGVYDSIVLEDCARVTLDRVRVGRLQLRHSSARAVHTVVGAGVVAQGSELFMTGGAVSAGTTGDVALDLDDSRLDLAGVAIETTGRPYRLEHGSRVLFSVCPLRTPAGVEHLQGFYGGAAAAP